LRIWNFLKRHAAPLGVVLAFLATLAAFATVHIQHQDQKELIRVQVAIEMVKFFDSSEMRRARRGFAMELLNADSGTIVEDRVLDFYETLALYSDQDRIDDDSVYTNFAHSIENYWAAARDRVLAMRKRDDDEEFYAGFEELSLKMTRTGANHRKVPPERLRPTNVRVKQFLEEEASLPE
jgi:hypothetical protein